MRLDNTCFRVGIDFSISSPAVFVAGEDIAVSYSMIKPKHRDLLKNLPVRFEQLADPKIMKSDLRFSLVATSIHDIILGWCFRKRCFGPSIAIEGYSFGSRFSQAHKIGEATGHLLSKLNDLSVFGINCRITRPSPMTVKSTVKLGGKTQSGKEAVYQAFTARFGFDLVKLLDSKKLESPITDICDSWACSETIGE